jgi:uncharacterized protein YllA (UPF0747 family)
VVLAAVYGPRAVQSRKEDPERMIIEVVCRPASGLQSASPRRRRDSAAAAEKARISRSSPTAHRAAAPVNPRRSRRSVRRRVSRISRV